jgi:outer membrane protein assembly factor BamB
MGNRVPLQKFVSGTRRGAVVAVAALALSATSRAADWSSFRGPNATGIARTDSLPVEFGPGKNVVWKTALPAGKSSPVLTENRIFLTGHNDTGLLTICLDRATGEILWSRTLPQERDQRLHRLNDRASPTPATDGANVYVFFGDFGLVSYGPEGNQRWVYPLGPFLNQHGMTASPILVDNKVILVCDQDKGSFVLALDKDTGEVVWRTERPEAAYGFATPAVFHPQGGEAQLVIPGSYVGIGYSLRTGEKLWWVRGLTWQAKPAAVVDGGIVVFTGWSPGADPGEQVFCPSF